MGVSECHIGPVVRERRWLFGSKGFGSGVEAARTSQTGTAVDPLGRGEDDSTSWGGHCALGAPLVKRRSGDWECF